MTSISKRPEERGGVLSTFDESIQTFNLAKDTCGIPSARAVFACAGAILTVIRVHFPKICENKLLTHVV